jgi:hypothetical protein
MPARIVNEMTYTAWCGECPYSTEPTIYRERAEAAVDAHNAEKHPPEGTEQPSLMDILRQSAENTRGGFA